MTSSIHYKFKSSLETESLFFDGPNISLSDLKKAIIEKKHMAALMGKFDLQIVNIQNREEYKPNDLVPKNTLVVVSRIPITKAVKKEPRKDLSTLEPLKIESIHLGSSSLLPTDLANLEVSEDKKIEIMINQSTQDYSHINYQLKPRNPSESVPRSYICHKCGQMGHFLQNCPNPKILDSEIGGVTRLKRSTGIPSSFMTPVNDINTPGVLINSSGKLVVPTIDALAYKEGKKEKPPFVKDSKPLIEPESKLIPQELLCPICKDFLKYAVVAPCCGNSSCDECIRNKIMESETFSCPLCNEKNISPDRLTPNVFMRTAVNNFMNERGYLSAKPVPLKPPDEAKTVVIAPPIVEKKNNITIKLVTMNSTQFSVPPPIYQPSYNYPPTTNVISSATINVFIGTNVFDETQRVIHRMIHPQTVSVAELQNLLMKTGSHRFSPGSQLVRMIVAHPIPQPVHQSVVLQGGQTIPSIVTTGAPRPLEKDHIKNQINTGQILKSGDDILTASSKDLFDKNKPKECHSNESLDAQGKPRRQQSDIFEFAEDIMYKKKLRLPSNSISPRSTTRRSHSYSQSKESPRRYRSNSRTRISKSRSRSYLGHSRSRSRIKNSRSRSMKKLSRSISKSRHSKSRTRRSKSKRSRSHSVYRSSSKMRSYKVIKQRSYSRSPYSKKSPIYEKRKHTPPKQYRSSSLMRHHEKSIDRIIRRRSPSRSYSRHRSNTPYDFKKHYSRSPSYFHRQRSFSRTPYRSRTPSYKTFFRKRSNSRKRHISRSASPQRKQYEPRLMYGTDMYNFSPAKIGLQYHGYDESDPRWIDYLKLYKQWYDKYGEHLGYPSKPPGLEHIDYKKIMNISTSPHHEKQRRKNSSKRKEENFDDKQNIKYTTHAIKDRKTSLPTKSKSKGNFSPAKKRITQLDEPAIKDKKIKDIKLNKKSMTPDNIKPYKNKSHKDDLKPQKEDSKSHINDSKIHKEDMLSQQKDVKLNKDDIKIDKDIEPHKDNINSFKEDIKPIKDVKNHNELIEYKKEKTKRYQEDIKSKKEKIKTNAHKIIEESSATKSRKIIEVNLKDGKSNIDSRAQDQMNLCERDTNNFADKIIEANIKEVRNNEETSKTKGPNIDERNIEVNYSDSKKSKHLFNEKTTKFKMGQDNGKKAYIKSKEPSEGKIESIYNKTSKDKIIIKINSNKQSKLDSSNLKELSDKNADVNESSKKSKIKDSIVTEPDYKPSNLEKKHQDPKGFVKRDKNYGSSKHNKRLRDESTDSKAESSSSKKSDDLRKIKLDKNESINEIIKEKNSKESEVQKIKNLVEYGDSSDDKEKNKLIGDKYDDSLKKECSKQKKIMDTKFKNENMSDNYKYSIKESMKKTKVREKSSDESQSSEEIKAKAKISASKKSLAENKTDTEPKKLKSMIATLPSSTLKTSESEKDYKESKHHKHKQHKHKSLKSPKPHKLMSQINKPRNILDQDNVDEDEENIRDIKQKKKKHKYNGSDDSDERHYMKHKSKKKKVPTATLR